MQQIFSGLFRASTAIILGVLSLFVLVVILYFARRWRLKQHLANRKLKDANRAALERGEICRRCGYSLVGLELPRCPECGTLKTFTTTLDEMGLTEAELKAAAAGMEALRAARESDEAM